MIKAWLLGLLCIVQTLCFATQPVNKLYAGVILGASATSNLTYTFNPSQIPASTINTFKSSVEQQFNITLPQVNALLPDVNVPGKLKYGILGGVGGDVGHRFYKYFRAELEFLYNNNPYKYFIIGNHTLSTNDTDKIYIEGDTNAFLGFANLYYDILIPGRDNFASVAPYIAIGGGYYYRENTLTFNYSTYETKFKRNTGALAAQGIMGVSMFMDDFCWITLDIRYMTTQTQNADFSQAGIKTSNRPQLLFIAFGFHGAIG